MSFLALLSLAACGKTEAPKTAPPVLKVASPRELFELSQSTDPKLRWGVLDAATQEARTQETNAWQKQLAADRERSERERVRLGLAKQPWEVPLDELILAEIAWTIAEEKRKGMKIALVREEPGALVVSVDGREETWPIVQEEGQWRRTGKP